MRWRAGPDQAGARQIRRETEGEIKDFPSVGAGRGIFELLVPGVFLLLNLAAIAHYSPATAESFRAAAEPVTSEATWGALLVVCFGYLLGVALRLLQVEGLDRLSALAIRLTRRGASQELYATERFPYIELLGENCTTRLPPAARDFWEAAWRPRCLAQGTRHNKQFLNYCKGLLISTGSGAAAEIHANESLSRYIAGVFYSLLLSSGLILCLWRLASPARLALPLACLLLLYVTVMAVILRNFRYLRIKEVEAVFTACLAERDRLKPFLT
jgi:hypothetical protein